LQANSAAIASREEQVDGEDRQGGGEAGAVTHIEGR
jgi:hypothetical protein